MRNARPLICLAFALLLAGCASWGPGGTPYRHAAGYTVTVPSEWIFHPSMQGSLLATRDGLFLQRLTIRELKLPHTLPISKRELSAALTPFEIAEILTDEGKADRSLPRFEVTAQSAPTLGSHPGLRTDYTHATEDGLRVSGRRWVAMRGNTLWIATYEAPSRYYHERDLAVITAAMESVSFAPKTTR